MSWTNNLDINQTSKFGPSLAVFNNKLYVAFIANNPGNAVLVCSDSRRAELVEQHRHQPDEQVRPVPGCLQQQTLRRVHRRQSRERGAGFRSSADGVNWTNNTDINQTSKFAPSLAVFNSKLYVAFIADNPGERGADLFLRGRGELDKQHRHQSDETESAPSLAVFNNKLYVVFIADNPGNAVLVCSSADGVNWTNNTDINQTSKFAPSLAVFNNKLYVAFIADNPGNAVLVCSSADGVNWTNNININQTSNFAPSLAATQFPLFEQGYYWQNWPVVFGYVTPN